MKHPNHIMLMNRVILVQQGSYASCFSKPYKRFFQKLVEKKRGKRADFCYQSFLGCLILPILSFDYFLLSNMPRPDHPIVLCACRLLFTLLYYAGSGLCLSPSYIHIYLHCSTYSTFDIFLYVEVLICEF